jgi:hypothetical protein
MIVAHSSGSARQNANEIVEIATLVHDVIIPGASQDFAALKGGTKRVDSYGSPVWEFKAGLPEGWSAEIRHQHEGIEFYFSFLPSETKKDLSWFYARGGGAWLVPMYNAFLAVLSGWLRDGWTRRSEEDNKFGQYDLLTGSQTRWTRRDGLAVTVSRWEQWGLKIREKKKFRRDMDGNTDPDLLPILSVSLAVLKPR